MFATIKGALTWFVGGLAEAALWAFDRIRPAPVYRVEVAAGDASVQAADGAQIGRIKEADSTERFEPPSLVLRLAGSVIDLNVPAAWLFRRTLDPVAQESVPFLDAFVRHQIERITPWRATDVHYRIRQTPIAGEASRVAIDVAIVPLRLVGPWLDALQPLKPKLVRIAAGHTSDADGAPAILIGQDTALRVGRLRELVALTLAGLALSYILGMSWIVWQASQVRDDIDAQDRVIDERKLVLARARHKDGPGGDSEQMQRLRGAQIRAVDVIEALALALPDSAHLTEFDLQKNHLTVSGVSTDTSVLVPALESSGRFADVAFGAATTKVESEAADRFHLDMRVLGRTAPQP